MVAKAISLYRGNLHKLPPKSPPRPWVLPRPKISLNDFRRSKALSLSSATNPSLGPTSEPPLPQDEEQHQAALLDQLNGAGNANLVVEPSKSTAAYDEAILNAEEELKRQSNVQTSCPHLPLQVNLSKNSGSMMRHATHRRGPDVNFTVNMEEREGDDVLNHGQWSRQLIPMNSMSPSAESALKRLPYLQHNLASHPQQAATLAFGSPSGNQVLPSNLQVVSVSGTNFVASSPSPAGAGATSCFRDARHPRPWN
ncbi:hypothetical protein Cgig2_006183 [Carnegiea gigantea]|uniref:Uncharacterized protein n=1 Tax=Carnegiea gigantea TaxID=171969 RepID=A0A9Q1KZF9_9CARY|nr:hypothetical protein Cgig2_006183 [Carnegiea gigantea]